MEKTITIQVHDYDNCGNYRIVEDRNTTIAGAQELRKKAKAPLGKVQIFIITSALRPDLGNNPSPSCRKITSHAPALLAEAARHKETSLEALAHTLADTVRERKDISEVPFAGMILSFRGKIQETLSKVFTGVTFLGEKESYSEKQYRLASLNLEDIYTEDGDRLPLGREVPASLLAQQSENLRTLTNKLLQTR